MWLRSYNRISFSIRKNQSAQEKYVTPESKTVAIRDVGHEANERKQRLT